MLKLINLFVVSYILNLYEDGDDVVQIKGKDDFTKQLAENPVTIVEFYAPWCGHCKNLAPEYKKAATELKKSGLKIAAIDATLDENKDLASEQGVSGFPTLKIINTKQGSGATDYNGGRTQDAIVDTMLKENKPVVSEVASLAEVTGSKPTFVHVGEMSAEVKKVAADKKAYVDFFTIATLEGQAAGTLALVEGGAVKETATADQAVFVNKFAYPLVGQLSPDNFQFYMDRGLDMFWFGLKADDTASVEIIKEGVKDFAGKYSYVWLDYEKFEGYMKQNLGCDAVNCGTLLKNQSEKLRLSDQNFTLTAENIKKFLEMDAAGSLKPWMKTQEVPETKEENNVVVLVGKNFKDETVGKNTFVFFYAPWCGHCKSAKPDYEKLKEELGRDDIVIAKFDATENDIPHPKINVEGFPTFFLIKADDWENPIVYNGGRKIEDWKNWLIEQVPAATKTDL